MKSVDLHFHLLPGVDDGPEGLDDALHLARAAVADGSRAVVTTPHVRDDCVADVLALPEMVRELRAEFVRQRIDLELHVGGELDHRMVGRLNHRELETIAQGPPTARWLLLEVPFEGVDEDFHAAADELRARGFGILLAHPERSADAIVYGSRGLRRELDRGALAQLTAASLLGDHGREARASARALLAEGMIALIASDAHGPTRPPLLSEARRVLADEPLATLLISAAPRRLLARGTTPRPSPVPRAA